jgi:hypothetical protein
MKLPTVISIRLLARRSNFSEESRISKKLKGVALSRVIATLPRLGILLFLLVALASCQSRNVIHYTSPEVTGRVLAADTHEPLAGASVQRVAPETFGSYWSFGSPKGGTLLMEPIGARTDAGGRFTLNSKSVFTIFRSPGWYSVPLVFSHPGYEPFQTNYTAANVVSNTTAGAPVVDAGDVLLKPAAR